MRSLHPWSVDGDEALRIQEDLRKRIILKNTFSDVKTIGGGDVSYSTNENLLFGAIVVLSFPSLERVNVATASGEIEFPYIPGFFSFREGPILIRCFQKLKVKPDLMIFDGHGIDHPRGIGLASHMGLWFDLPSIGCAKTPLSKDFRFPGPSKGSYELTRREGKDVGAALRTGENVKPVFVSPGHRIDLLTSIQFILASCRGFRIPEPLRQAHHVASLQRRQSA
jgi:deoxyribonuclease V